MSDQTDKLTGLLKPFGLSDEEAQIYLVLLEKGTLSALTISRDLHMGRTKVYRVLDKLIAKGLVTNRYDEAGFKFVANSPTQLELLLSRREGELSALRQSLPQVTKTLDKHTGSGQLGSQVLYYRGQRGLSQVNYNLLNAQGEYLSYEVVNAEAYLPHKEAEQLRRELVAAKITNRMLTNRKQFEAFTDVTKMVRQYWQVRWVDPNELAIQADVFIYNDVYALCHYLKDGDVFCVEMINQELATMQKQLFEYLWTRSKPLTILNDRGEAALES